MNILLLGAAGFIGTNLTISLARNGNDQITVVDKNIDFFSDIKKFDFENVTLKDATFENDMDFDTLLQGQDVVYHLVSTTIPGTSNQQIAQEIVANVVFTANLLEACVRCAVKRFIFISSGGAVYGKEVGCPLKEDTATYPISSYGVQKITIEKLLYLYNHMYGLDYRVVRLANPYGPYQRPNGVLGVITTFTYNALNDKEIVVYGDGTVVRDFIYIDDAIEAILKISSGTSRYHTFNLGSGKGMSINEVLASLKRTLKVNLNVIYKEGRNVDVPINYLDISRYEECFGKLNPVSLEEGIKRTAIFLLSKKEL